MNELAEQMMFESHDFIGEMVSGHTLAVDIDALQELDHWGDGELGGFIRLRLLMMRWRFDGANSGADQAETVTEPAPDNDDAVASRATDE